MSNVLIIGGSSGIGLELLHLLAQDKNKIFATYHQHPQANWDKVIFQKFNVLEDDIQHLNLPEKLDGLVYCPGSIVLKPILRLTEADFLSDFRLQIGGLIKILPTVLPLLKSSGTGSIVTYSSVAAQIGMNFHSVVSTTKSALEGLSKALAAELAPHIRVNCISPSITNTPLSASLLNSEDKISRNAERHPLKRIGSARDIAELTAFLLSEKSTWITGQVIHADGGLSAIR